MRVEAGESSAPLAGAVRLRFGEIDGNRRIGVPLRGGPDDGQRGGNAAAADAEGQPCHGASGHAVTRDRVDRDRIRPTIYDLLRHAQKKSGRPAFEMLREFIRLHRGSGRLTWPEYVQYGVYDKTRHSPDDQAKFLTNTLHWPITRACSPSTVTSESRRSTLRERVISKARSQRRTSPSSSPGLTCRSSLRFFVSIAFA